MLSSYLKAKLGHPLALLGGAFVCLMCGGESGTGPSTNAGGSQNSTAGQGGTQAGNPGNGGTSGVRRSTTTPNGSTPQSCTLDSACPYPASVCQPTTNLLTYYTNPRCENMVCTYDVTTMPCGVGTTTAGGFPVYDAGPSGSGGNGGDSGGGGAEQGGEAGGP